MAGLALSRLKIRFMSALIMIPVVVGAIWVGGYAFGAFIGLIAGLAFYELLNLSKASKYSNTLFIVGGVYLTISFLLCYHLRIEHGILVTVSFFLLMWSSDIGAYFAGKLIGGPKMTPDVSPNKTWAGFGGALLGPALVFVLLHNFSFEWVYIIGGILLGITGQSGDLLISWLKRQAHVKDAGDLIPGHGGILDRVDSLIPAVPVYLALLKFSGAL